MLQIDEEKKSVMAHAGITPQWDLQTAKECARDVEAVLSSDSYPFFDAMYGDMPNNWSPELRARKMAFYHQRLYPYAFLLSKRSTGYVQQRIAGRSPCPTETVVCDSWPVAEEYSIAFGHWASLEGKGTPEASIYALDTGCCWGGSLTCLRWEDKQYFVQPSNRHKDLGEAAAS
ncbi:hypothetical protein ACLK14_00285 [Escherichia coli]